MTLRRRTPVVRSDRRRTPLLIEPVEPRTLLAASLNGGLLTIAGTGSADAYTVKLSGSNLVVQRAGEAAQSFAKASVTKIVANLGGGNDSILIDDNVNTPATLNGEAGDDTLRGSSASDSIDGGAGSDTVTYAGRVAGVKISASVESWHNDGSDTTPVGFGFGGTGAESDIYNNIETVAGGEGNDTIGLFAGRIEGYVAGSAPFVLRGEGGGGNDAFTLQSSSFNGTSAPYYPESVNFIADGGQGNDTFDVGGNRDPVLGATVYGGEGDDTYIDSSDDGFATFVAGGGVDTKYVSMLPQMGPVTFTLEADLENLSVSGPAQVIIYGNDSNNRIVADVSLAATIYGGGGNDTLVGSAGNDSIDGGAGNDTVSYNGRTAPITASLKLTSFYYSGQDSTPVAVGSGGQAGEADTYASVETIVGGDGNDTITLGGYDRYDSYSSRPNPIRGEGGLGDDTFFISSGLNSNNSQLSITADGGQGNDTFDTSANLDFPVGATVYGGEGDDTYIDDSIDGFSTFVAGPGVDTARQSLFPSQNGSYTLAPDLENAIVSGPANLTVYGNNLNNQITADGGRVTVYGMGGDDTIVTGGGDDFIDAGAGNDRIDPGEGDDTVDGGTGGDALTYVSSSIPVTGTLRANLVSTGSGYAVQRVATTKQIKNGGTYTDTATNIEVLSGSTGNDTLTAEAGPGDWNNAAGIDRSSLILNGEAGDDLLSLKGIDPKSGQQQNTPVMLANGMAGDDKVYAYYDARDTIDGGDGNDTFAYVGNYGVANVVGGNDLDTLYIKRYAGPGESLTYTMPGTLENLVMQGPGRIDVVGNELANNISMQGAEKTWVRGLGGNDTIYGTEGNDALDGGDGDDVIYGNGGDDRLWGFAGRDTLYGGAGVDQLWGGNDNDRLDGGAGADSIWGEAGTDTYVKDPSDALVSGVEAYA